MRLDKKTILRAAKVHPELDKMIAQFRKGDEVIVWKLDPLGSYKFRNFDINTYVFC